MVLVECVLCKCLWFVCVFGGDGGVAVCDVILIYGGIF